MVPWSKVFNKCCKMKKINIEHENDQDGISNNYEDLRKQCMTEHKIEHVLQNEIVRMMTVKMKVHDQDTCKTE